MTISATLNRLRQFRLARGWQKYHTPEQLVRALAVEVGELQQLYLWGTRPERDRLAEEIADVGIYLLNLCDVTGIDLLEAVNAKIDQNLSRHWDEQAWG
jgi:NTP pyrophosphatase (non-canonical NTP hydrolase)